MNRKLVSAQGVRSSLLLFVFLLVILYGCANRVSPGGGPYDETPPRFLGSDPAPGSLGVKEGRVVLHFDEYIKLRDLAKRVIISPPQLQQPQVMAIGKRVVVELLDSLQPETTYTLDFTDAIVDNNEDNPLNNFSFAFSTGSVIDTMAIGGQVLDARTLEPVQGVLVGIHPESSPRSHFKERAFMRMSRTSDRSHFVIRNIKHGRYHLYALKEGNGNYRTDQLTDGVAFLDSTLLTTSLPAMRNDTIWRDSLHVDTIIPVAYTRFLPDDIVLRYYLRSSAKRHIIKRERKDSMLLELAFNAPLAAQPSVRPIGASWVGKDTSKGYALDRKGSELKVYLLDRTWFKADSFAVTYASADSLELPTMVTDSMVLRLPKPQRTKEELRRPTEEPSDSAALARPELSPLKVSLNRVGTGGPADSLGFVTTLPIDSSSLAGITMQVKRDTLWKPHPIRRIYLEEGSSTRGWIETDVEYKQEYRVVFDSLAFVDLYGHHLDKSVEETFQVKPQNDFSQLEIELLGVKEASIVEVVDTQDKVQRVVYAKGNRVQIKDLAPGKYGVRLIADSNGNGCWDAGDFDQLRQPEEVFYLPKVLELRKNWKLKESWAPRSLPLAQQKPAELMQAKFEDKNRRELNKKREEEERNRRKGQGNNATGLGGLGGVLGSGGLQQAPRNARPR